MAKLYFRYGAMGSSKTANAIMVQYNYHERGQNALLIKPRLDSRDGERVVASRSGLRSPCIYMEDIDSVNLKSYDCIIVDEAQFLKREQIWRLTEIADEMNIPVICYGLRADFQGNLFEGSTWLMAWADTIEEIKTVCWCGRKATYNARVVDGKVAREGEQIVLGGNESYVALCRRHWKSGTLAPKEIRKISAGKSAYMHLLLDADPSEESIARYLDDGDLYVMMIDGKPAAELLLLPHGDSCELCSLAVLPDARGSGYARSLIEFAKNLCKTKFNSMTVRTAKPLIPFFEKFGFRHERTLEDDLKDACCVPGTCTPDEAPMNTEIMCITL